MKKKQLRKAFPTVSVGLAKKMTIVDCFGKILRVGDQGVIIVDSQDERPVLIVSEMSGDDTIHVFVNVAEEASALTESESSGNGYEVLMNR